MMDAFVTFENRCDRHSRWVLAEDVKALADNMEAALVHLNALASEAATAGKFLWHLTPKCHMGTHLAYDFAAFGVNPRRITCYADEDMVGRCKHCFAVPWQHCRQEFSFALCHYCLHSMVD